VQHHHSCDPIPPPTTHASPWAPPPRLRPRPPGAPAPGAPSSSPSRPRSRPRPRTPPYPPRPLVDGVGAPGACLRPWRVGPAPAWACGPAPGASWARGVGFGLGVLGGVPPLGRRGPRRAVGAPVALPGCGWGCGGYVPVGLGSWGWSTIGRVGVPYREGFAGDAYMQVDVRVIE
jgi:hypothetical protein